MSQNPFFRSFDSQTFMSHSFIPALIYGLKVYDPANGETRSDDNMPPDYGETESDSLSGVQYKLNADQIACLRERSTRNEAYESTNRTYRLT